MTWESILPPLGTPVEGWKKCRDRILVRLLVPAEARRVEGRRRACRAEFVYVLEVCGPQPSRLPREAISLLGPYPGGTAIYGESDAGNVGLIYREGTFAYPDRFDASCEGDRGISFYLTQEEASAFGYGGIWKDDWKSREC